MIKRLKFYLIGLLILVPTGLAFYFYFFGSPRGVTRQLADPPALVLQIQQLSELVTVKYNIEKVIGLGEQKIPFGQESLLLLVRAGVLGGVDLSQLTPADVTVAADQSVTIRLPAAKILHVVTNEKETKVWDRKITWWTPWVPFNPELDQKARQLALESMRAAALEMGILRESQANAEKTIRNFLAALGVESVSFEPAPTTP